MHPADNQELIFHEETDEFHITSNLHQDKLKITLKDFIDYAIYFKQYTQQDIGKQIHRKMDLADVYNAFSQTKLHANKKTGSSINQIKSQHDQTAINNQKNPNFKVERQGKITVYHEITDAITKKQTINQSKLTLIKVRNMIETQISDVKAIRQKKQIFYGLKKQIDIQKKEKEELAKKVLILQQENIKLRQQLTQIKAELKTTKQELPQKIQQKLTQAKKQFQLLLKKAQSQFADQIHKTRQELNLSLWCQTKQLNSVQTALSYTNLQQPYANCFRLTGLKLQYIGNDKQWTQYIFNHPINNNQFYKFKVKVLQTITRSIMVGVLEYSKQRDKRKSHNSGNAMCYKGLNGQKWPQSGRQGDGFKEGDIVEIQVDRQNHIVKYIVNGALKATDKNKMLADGSEVFMPYVELGKTNDMVELVLE